MSIEKQLEEEVKVQNTKQFRQNLICAALTGLIARRVNYSSAGEYDLLAAIAIELADEVLRQVGE